MCMHCACIAGAPLSLGLFSGQRVDNAPSPLETGAMPATKRLGPEPQRDWDEFGGDYTRYRKAYKAWHERRRRASAVAAQSSVMSEPLPPPALAAAAAAFTRAAVDLSGLARHRRCDR